MKYARINEYHSIIPLLCLIIMAVSCIKEVEPSEVVSNTFTGVAENSDVRAQLNADGTAAWWEQNDAIRIFCDEGDAKFTSTLTAPGSTSDFVCDQHNFPTDAKQYIAVYPYSQNDTYDGESITITIPSVQTAIEESFDRSAFVMMAQSSNHTLDFKNLCGGVKVKFFKSGFNRIVIRGNNNEILAGKVKVQFLDGVPVVKEILEGEQTVELCCPSGKSFQNGWYYIPCLPVTLSQGYSVEIWETDNETIKGEFNCPEQSSIMRSTWSRLYRVESHVSYSSSQSLFYISLGDNTPRELNASEHVVSHYKDYRSGYFVIVLDKETHELDGGLFKDGNAHLITRIIIPSCVTSVGGFGRLTYPFDNLKMVIIPSSVTSIKDEAFLKCTSLEIIDLPPSVTSIGSSAFASCHSLKSITIPNGVTSIEKETFHYCRSLESVTIPSSVTTIGMKAFRCCTSLKSIDIPSSVTSIGPYAFESCDNIKRVTIPSSVTSIGNYAFQRCDSLKSVTISSSVTNIGHECFEVCNSLDSVIVRASVPPVIGPSSSYAYSAGFPSGVKIYVPYSAVEAYKSSINWEKYKTNIVGADIHEDDLPPENPPVDNPPVENATYQVSDIYKENGHAVGIVFWVADDGRSAKVVSLSRLSGEPWSNEASLTNFGVTSTDDGAGNTAAIRSEAAAAGIFDKIPWLGFLEDLGDGWYLPAINELKTLAATYYGVDSYGKIPSGTPNTLASSVVSKMEMFEKLITDNGGTRINTMSGDQNGDSLFSSTETDSGDKAYYVRFGKISHDTGNKTSTVRTFRGVKLVTK